MTMINVIFFAIWTILTREYVTAVRNAQNANIEAAVIAGGIACIKDHPLSLSDIKSLRNKQLPDGNNAKCFIACLFKKIGIMDDMGNISTTKAKESAQNIFKNNEEHLTRADQFIEKCSSVNEQNTNDGNKGCERAKLVFTCLTENAPKFGFNVDF